MRLKAFVLASLIAGSLLAACAGGSATDGVSVRLDEMRFLPSTIEIESGQRTFVVRNVGELRHTFSLNAVGEEVTVEPGKTKSMNVELQAGTYRYVCRILDHEGLGMKGTLRVRAS